MAYPPDADNTGRPSLDHHFPFHRLLLNPSHRGAHDVRSTIWHRRSLRLQPFHILPGGMVYQA